jgi:hypothetical protein
MLQLHVQPVHGCQQGAFKPTPEAAVANTPAASGGYYMAMAASQVVSEPLTITGSIGVVTAKFNLAQLYQRIGYAKTIISRWAGRGCAAARLPFLLCAAACR